jgi:pimeloyl-ACP methyl ester carboxylesterase
MLQQVQALRDRYVTIDGLRVRYIEQGEGHPVLFLHGASLGSSADVFVGNINQFAQAGFRAIASDVPGFGLSETPADQTSASQRDSIPKFIDALGLNSVALMAHSRAGGFAMQLALADPRRYSHLVILGTGSLLPPQSESQVGRYEAVQARVDRQMAEQEPTIEDTRKLLQADVFNHSLITDEALAVRHSRSIGACFAAHVARQADENPGQAASGKPAWQRLTELKMPLLMIYGREDRAHAAERAHLLKQIHPELQIHVVSNCKHMVPWDAANDVFRLAVPFLRSPHS